MTHDNVRAALGELVEERRCPVSEVLDTLREYCEDRAYLVAKLKNTYPDSREVDKWHKIAAHLAGAYRQVLLTEMRGK